MRRIAEDLTSRATKFGSRESISPRICYTPTCTDCPVGTASSYAHPVRILKFFKQALLTAATLTAITAGFLPTPKVWKERLPTLEGEFHRSPAEVVYRYGLAALFISAGGLLTGLTIREYITNRFDAQFILLSGMAVSIFSAAIYYLTRTGIWCKFDHGVVSAFRANGQRIWTESLSRLSCVICGEGYGVTFMTLR